MGGDDKAPSPVPHPWPQCAAPFPVVLDIMSGLSLLLFLFLARQTLARLPHRAPRGALQCGRRRRWWTWRREREVAPLVGEAAAWPGDHEEKGSRAACGCCNGRSGGDRGLTANSPISTSWWDKFLGEVVANSSKIITYMFGFFWAKLRRAIRNSSWIQTPLRRYVNFEKKLCRYVRCNLPSVWVQPCIGLAIEPGSAR
jgi:hypothetical protein